MDTELKEHIKSEHHLSSAAQYLEEIVYGGIDGIVTTFAVVASFAGAGGEVDGATTTLVVLLFGLANLFADGFSMGLGNFLSIRSAQDIFRTHKKKEQYEIQHHPEAEGKETIEILMEKGYNRQDAEAMLALYMKNKPFWTDFMMNYELELIDTTNESSVLKGMTTFLSFIIFGFIPLIPYTITIGTNTINNNQMLSNAVMFTSLALLLLSVIRWRVSHINFFRSFFETFTVGVLSGGIAFLIGIIFKSF